MGGDNAFNMVDGDDGLLGVIQRLICGDGADFYGLLVRPQHGNVVLCRPYQFCLTLCLISVFWGGVIRGLYGRCR